MMLEIYMLQMIGQIEQHSLFYNIYYISLIGVATWLLIKNTLKLPIPLKMKCFRWFSGKGLECNAGDTSSNAD